MLCQVLVGELHRLLDKQLGIIGKNNRSLNFVRREGFVLVVDGGPTPKAVPSASRELATRQDAGTVDRSRLPG
jgi:hypothetical protein